MHQHASSTALWRAMHDAIAELLQPRSDRARAQIDRIQPRAALRGVFRYVLFQARDVCLVCWRANQGQLGHVESRRYSSGYTDPKEPHASLRRSSAAVFLEQTRNLDCRHDAHSKSHVQVVLPHLQQCV